MAPTQGRTGDSHEMTLIERVMIIVILGTIAADTLTMLDVIAMSASKPRFKTSAVFNLPFDTARICHHESMTKERSTQRQKTEMGE